MRTIAALALLCLTPLVAQEAVDLSVVHRIRTEAFEHSKVMEHLSYISDAYGPRLTGSPEFKQAADWAANACRIMDFRTATLKSGVPSEGAGRFGSFRWK